MADGLYHMDDGRKFFPDGQEVTGANNLAQQKSKSHHKKHHKSKTSRKHKKEKKHHHSVHKKQSMAQEPADVPITDMHKQFQTLGEEEQNAKEVADAKAEIEANAFDKAKNDLTAAEKAKAEAMKTQYKIDGLYHLDDGTRVEKGGKIVGGVNNYVQKKRQGFTSLV